MLRVYDAIKKFLQLLRSFPRVAAGRVYDYSYHPLDAATFCVILRERHLRIYLLLRNIYFCEINFTHPTNQCSSVFLTVILHSQRAYFYFLILTLIDHLLIRREASLRVFASGNPSFIIARSSRAAHGRRPRRSIHVRVKDHGRFRKRLGNGSRSFRR